MGVIAGLNMSPISRLKATKKDLNNRLHKSFKKLEVLMHPNASFKNYRNRLHASTPPCLPYLGVYLSDLTFMEDGNPDKVDGLINFAKRRLMHGTIEEVQQYQVTPYNISKMEPAYTYLVELPILSEKDLYELSLAREPRKQTK